MAEFSKCKQRHLVMRQRETAKSHHKIKLFIFKVQIDCAWTNEIPIDPMQLHYFHAIPNQLALSALSKLKVKMPFFIISKQSSEMYEHLMVMPLLAFRNEYSFLPFLICLYKVHSSFFAYFLCILEANGFTPKTNRLNSTICSRT